MPVLWFWLFALVRVFIYIIDYFGRSVDRTKSKVNDTPKQIKEVD